MYIIGMCYGGKQYSMLLPSNKVVEAFGGVCLENDMLYCACNETTNAGLITLLEECLNKHNIKYVKKYSQSGTLYYEIEVYIKQYVKNTIVIRIGNHPNNTSRNLLFDSVTRNVLIKLFIKLIDLHKGSVVRALRKIHNKIEMTNIGGRKYFEYKK